MKTSKDYEEEFLSIIKEKTGNDLNSWMKIVKGTSLSKMKEIVEWLKKEKGINHMSATFIAGIFLNDGKPVYGDTGDLKSSLFKGKETLLPLYEELQKKLESTFDTLEIVPTKTYISFRDGREFAVASIKVKEIRVGLDLGDLKFDDYIQKAVSLGAMPRISHMIVIKEKSDVDKKLIDNLKTANQRIKK
jgi:predicted transport protein